MKNMPFTHLILIMHIESSDMYFVVKGHFCGVDRNKSWPWFLFASDLEIEKFVEEFPHKVYFLSNSISQT